MAKMLELQYQSFQWIFRVDFWIDRFDLLAVQGTPKSFLLMAYLSIWVWWGDTSIQSIASTFCTKTMDVPAKKLSEKMEKMRDGYPDRESTNFYSWGPCSFSGSKHQLMLETVQEQFQLEFSRRINALFIPNFIPHILWASKYHYSVWYPIEDNIIGSWSISWGVSLGS